MRLVCPILMAMSTAPLCAAAQTPHADAPTLSVETRAQDLYGVGRDHFREGDFAGALEDFRRSLDLVESPNTRMYLGRALRRLGRLPEAFATLERAASDAGRRAVSEPRYAATQESARAEADEIRGGIALLTVRLASPPPGSTIHAAGAEVPLSAVGFPLPFAPGEVMVEFDAPGYAPARQILILNAGGEATVDLAPRLDDAPAPAALAVLAPPAAPAVAPLALRPLSPPPVTPRTWTTTRLLGVTSLAAGAASLATGVVFGAIAWSEHETLRAQGEPNEVLVTRGEFHRDLANVLLASGSALAVGGLVLFWLGGRAVSDAPRPALGFSVTAAGPFVSLRGTL